MCFFSRLLIIRLFTNKPLPPPILPKPSKSLSSAILIQKKLKSKSELNINSLIPNDTKTNTFLSKITAFNSINNKNLNRVTPATTSSQVSSSQGYHSDTMESNLSDPVNDNKTDSLKIEEVTSSSLSTLSTGSNNLSPLTNVHTQATPPLMSKSLISFNGSQNQSM
jgi:lysozyme family protein